MLAAAVADVPLYAADVHLFAVYEEDLVVLGGDGWDIVVGGGGGGGGFVCGGDGGSSSLCGGCDSLGGGYCCFAWYCCWGGGAVAGDVALGAGAGLAEDFGYVGRFGVLPEVPAFEAGFVHFGAVGPLLVGSRDG